MTAHNDTENLVLALLSEEAMKAPALAKKAGKHLRGIKSVLLRLKRKGAVASDAGTWRTHGPAVSKLREEKDPAPAKAVSPKASIRDAIVVALRGGPMGRGDIVEAVAPIMAGRHNGNVDAALGGLKLNGTIFRDGKMWRLGAGAPEAKPRASARSAAAPAASGAIGLLRAERDRIDRAIAVLEGRS